MASRICRVCRRRLSAKLGDGLFLCTKCQASFDSAKITTPINIIIWAVDHTQSEGRELVRLQHERLRSVELLLKQAGDLVLELRRELDAYR